MKRAFVTNINSEYIKQLEHYLELCKQQRLFINDFFNQYEIESEEYHVSGDGFVNQPFDNLSSSIKLYINPTENDLSKFDKLLNKPNRHQLRAFRANTKISKDFTKQCIEKNVVINLYRPRIGDYFKTINYSAYSYSLFKHDEKYYILVECEFLTVDDTPTGFEEIKLSEFYKIQETKDELAK